MSLIVWYSVSLYFTMAERIASYSELTLLSELVQGLGETTLTLGWAMLIRPEARSGLALAAKMCLRYGCFTKNKHL